jgi:NDP-mannose synthase
MNNVKAVIMAGGKGQRLRPFTTVFPKPLMPIGDVPMLDLVVRQLRHFGFTEITVTVGYLAELVLAYLGDGAQYGVKIHFVLEREPLGTIGPLASIENHGESVLVINGDVLTTIDYTDLVRSHRESGAAATVATYRRPYTVDKGIVTVDAQNRVGSFLEKPTYHHLVVMGIYVIEPDVLRLMTPGAQMDAPELVQKLLDSGQHVHSYQFDGYWLDIGKPADYDKATAEFDSLRAALLHEDTK